MFIIIGVQCSFIKVAKIEWFAINSSIDRYNFLNSRKRGSMAKCLNKLK